MQEGCSYVQFIATLREVSFSNDSSMTKIVISLAYTQQDCVCIHSVDIPIRLSVKYRNLIPAPALNGNGMDNVLQLEIEGRN